MTKPTVSYSLMDNTGIWYNLVFAILILLFTYFYTAITINPAQMANDLKRNNGFIPGVKPGKATRTTSMRSWTASPSPVPSSSLSWLLCLPSLVSSVSLGDSLSSSVVRHC